MPNLNWKNNKVTVQLLIDYPIFQAPMAGGITTASLVSGVSNCGGLGNIGAGYLQADEIRNEIHKVRELTTKPFGVNLFVPTSMHVEELATKQERMNAILAKYEDELHVPKQVTMIELADNSKKLFEAQLEEVLKAKVSICSFTFGIPEQSVIKELKQNGAIVIGTATNVEEAYELVEAGMDMIVAQGSEAGGHRGTFRDERTGMIGTMALVPQIVDAVKVPVIAAGGIMDGRGIAASFMLGAEAVQLGTAFLPCMESGANPVYKKAVIDATEDETTMTKAFSGKLARGVSNRFMEEMKLFEAELLPFPLQNTMTGNIRKQAGLLKNKDFMSLWAGQGVRLAKEMTAAELMTKLISETDLLLG